MRQPDKEIAFLPRWAWIGVVVKPDISSDLEKLYRILRSNGNQPCSSSRLRRRAAFVRGSTDESVQSSEKSVQHLPLFHTCGRLHI